MLLDLNRDIQVRCLSVEQDFLQAIQDDSLESFYDAWGNLSVDLEDGVTKGTLDAESSSIANAVASRIELLAQSFAELDVSTDLLASQFLPEAASIIDEWQTEEISTSFLRPSTPETCASSSDSNHLPSQIPEACEWLLRNIHNPYPSNNAKDRISKKSGIPVKSISDWFVKARKRIGWMSLMKTHFGGNKTDILDCAYRVFKGDDHTNHLSQSLVDKFLEMKDRVSELYNSKFVESDLAKKLEAEMYAPGSVIAPGNRPSPSRALDKARTASLDSSSTLYDSARSSSRKRRANSNEDDEWIIYTHPSQRPTKRSRSMASATSTCISRQPTLTIASSPSGASTPAPTTPILAPAHFNFATAPTLATASQPAQLNTLIDDWLATLKSASPASPVDDLPSAQISSKKRRNTEDDEDERESFVGRKKARMVSESASEASTATFDPKLEGLYPTSSLETAYANANTEALYALTSTLDLPQPVPQAVDDLFSTNEFGNTSSLGDGNLNIGLGLGPASSSINDQPLEVGMGSYGFADLTSSADLGFGFGSLPSASASSVDALGLEMGAGTNLASVLQQLHPPTQQRHFEAPPPAPETIPLPAQGADEVTKLANPIEEEQLLTLALSEEEIAALAGCLDGNQLDLTGDVFGLAFDAPSTMCAPVQPIIMPSIDVESIERDAKLTRLQSLLAEVNQLQQEVFC